jgi:hypothetical protein
MKNVVVLSSLVFPTLVMVYLVPDVPGLDRLHLVFGIVAISWVIAVGEMLWALLGPSGDTSIPSGKLIPALQQAQRSWNTDADILMSHPLERAVLQWMSGCVLLGVSLWSVLPPLWYGVILSTMVMTSFAANWYTHKRVRALAIVFKDMETAQLPGISAREDGVVLTDGVRPVLRLLPYEARAIVRAYRSQQPHAITPVPAETTLPPLEWPQPAQVATGLVQGDPQTIAFLQRIAGIESRAEVAARWRERGFIAAVTTESGRPLLDALGHAPKDVREAIRTAIVMKMGDGRWPSAACLDLVRRLEA